MKPRKVKGGEWQLAGVVGVDSGRLLITDYPDHPTVKFDAVTERLMDEAKHQHLHRGDLPRLLAIPFEKGYQGAGVSVSTGLGDGLYEVWALIGEVFIGSRSWGKRVLGVRIQFITPKERTLASAVLQKQSASSK